MYRLPKQSQFISLIRSWWWPAYALIYPLLMTRLEFQTRFAAYEVRAWFTLAWVIIALLTEWISHPRLRFADLLKLNLTIVKKHPLPFFAILYVVWAFFAAFFTSDPAVNLTGTLDEGVEGAFWVLLLSFMFILAYIKSLEDKKFSSRLAWGVIIGGATVGFIALLEVLLSRGLIYNVPISALPMSSFPQRGHLAGYLVFVAGTAIGLWLQSKNAIVFALILCLTLVIGTTQNRASIAALGCMTILILIFAWRKYWKPLAIIMTLSALSFALGFLLKQRSDVQFSRNLQDKTSTETRLLYWKAAGLAILDRPVFGWGPAGYYQSWPDYLNSQELRQVFRLEYGVEYLNHFNNSFLVKDERGQSRLLTITGWRSHNQFLETALMRGLPGLIIYIVLLLLIFKRIEAPLNLGVLTYHFFLFTWFIPVETVGLVWLIWGAGSLNTQKEGRADAASALPTLSKGK